MPTRHAYLDGPHPRAFAHRGWHVDDLAGMENALSAFRRAVAEGYHYLETDVHATADGVVVVHHDPVLDRTTDGRGEVARLPWRAVSGARVAGREPVCRLTDLLEELPEARLNVDVKSDAAVEPVVEVLRRTGAWARVCLASFDERRLTRLRRLGGPRLLTSLGPRSVGALWAGARLGGLPLRRAVRGALAQVPRRHGRLTVVDRSFVRVAHRWGLEVHVWTVDSEAEMVELLDMGVDGLVTDRPDLLRSVLRSRGSWPAAV
ncbi:glycerophosphoryl diester phosphodiesterase [Streptoalloteichus tenebrarius]|uniref:Glycerophosphoryl diester phosphodiesterase n=1 Tax=Streptoalloteichus tenebrarius (strain ATCC 17920 / DSM 40477 / JCM 4838 / CBS 697.72 / NBRC 16177 / NCIMB 11028 / NRRL B-12390 / A12253. 1 / ISP 5477) TaxID=1933 RepID=A0ABT1HQ40_STRSD|nr:glycerophosphodiester phosphodiesterase family protein [Streptoalloteichus tenebrarius]MCP2257629.1 glycerophosphoryl diester phosphodiesterase [Streptoalloteichus tenebrarius]BFE98588.1 glycerophosphodiester phosphodiesterase [Streptoalloteichus tenebrarius]